MTVGELEERMTVPEFEHWKLLYDVEREAAEQEAENQSRRRPKGA